MKRWLYSLAVLALGVALWGGTSMAQTKAGCDKASTPEKLVGQVVSVDVNQGKVTVRGDDGKTHEFQASKETVQGYKVGDRITATLRPGTGCN